MGIGPKLNNQKKKTFLLKTCERCGQQKGPDEYCATTSFFYPDGYMPVCAECLNSYFKENDWNWEAIDKICQIADVPFVPKEWIRMQEIAGDDAFKRYCEVFLTTPYDSFGWDDYFCEFKRLREEGRLEDQIPEIDEQKRKQLVKKWDGEYSPEDFERLEDLLDGMLMTQNITTKLQMDQALKICKLSLEIDSCIRASQPVDKLLSSYEKLIKIANFTPKNSKNASDLESVGELFKWLEAGGWRNRYYDGATRDVVDETMKNIQNWNQRLYVNETGIGEEIARRIEQLRAVAKLEQDGDEFSLNEEYDSDKHEVDGYNELFTDQEEEDFAADLGGGEVV